jgi:hypothetical protein
MNAHAPSGTATLERPPASQRRPWVALLDVTQTVSQGLMPALQEAGFEIRAPAVIESSLLEADAVIVEADRGARMLSGMQALRGLLDRVYVVGIVGWWSEYESDVLRTADAVLHVPLRKDDLTAAVIAIRNRVASLQPVAAR